MVSVIVDWSHPLRNGFKLVRTYERPIQSKPTPPGKVPTPDSFHQLLVFYLQQVQRTYRVAGINKGIQRMIDEAKKEIPKPDRNSGNP